MEPKGMNVLDRIESVYALASAGHTDVMDEYRSFMDIAEEICYMTDLDKIKLGLDLLNKSTALMESLKDPYNPFE